MNRFRVWGIAAALAVGVAAPAGAADPPADPADTTDARPWYKKMFFSAPKPAGPTVRSGPVTGMPGRPPVGSTLSPAAVAEARKAEDAAWDRRMKVCDSLRAAAIERKDDALLRQADDLERQAHAVYQQRIAALGLPKVKAPLPAASEGGFAASFSLAPEQALDPTAAASALVAPAAPVPATGTASLEPQPPGPPPRKVNP